ncbi:hypothetical protein HH310_29835 [Actinoplanes sp. TBRC 11911]|uniref:hypothetical protein n=1 Tax=Actinoplanes sp. TBRC 11911 TaxID=2729386 RepID=UPI00145E39A5|nr:hypothetical protein [Actinoplanes sp. TBRC 11911]NMO55371.1 hypothetical protein [Actinoplanes sp. TBRC 11911]
MVQVVEVQHRMEAFHRLLLRMAGRLSDELIAEARRWLAAEEFVLITQALAFAVNAARVTLTETELALLMETVTDAGADIELLAGIEQSEADQPPFYGFAPVSPEVLERHRDEVPYSLDLTIPYYGPGASDDVDAEVASAVEGLAVAGAGPVALWRAWRFPGIDTPWPRPRRIYLLQAEDELSPPELAVRLQDALELAGEIDPQVEAFANPDDLPTYQRIALAFSALLWTAAPPAPVVLTRVFDTFTEEGGPGFHPAHPLLVEIEREKVASYLEDGARLLATSELDPDVLDPGRGPVVPVTFRTDGRCIWTDAAGYYLREYGLAPDPDLLDEIRANDYRPPPVDAVARHRALNVLYGPGPEQPPAGSDGEQS